MGVATHGGAKRTLGPFSFTYHIDADDIFVHPKSQASLAGSGPDARPRVSPAQIGVHLVHAGADLVLDACCPQSCRMA